MPNHTQTSLDGHTEDKDLPAAAADGSGLSKEVSPALQIVCLGSGGGPNEDNVTGFLVRSLDSGWAKGGLLAVDAGSHLAAITRILEKSFPLYSKSANGTAETTGTTKSAATEKVRPPTTVLDEGPFRGLEFRHESARANALELLHTYIACYLITHPHLDHLSGFAINTAAFHGRSRPKTLAALPGTVEAVKRHIFNDVIWPNLSDEDGGVGFVSFQRLKEGGDLMIGEGDARGYINVCDGLAARAFTVSHGLCTKTPSLHHRGSISNGVDFAAAFNGYDNAEPAAMNRAMNLSEYPSTPGTPRAAGGHRHSVYNALGQAQYGQSHGPCGVDSTAYFVRDEETAREVLIFGDVEPDSISIAPRNEQVWAEAAPRIANGVLRGILIECSYSDAASDETLFGHLCPRHLIAELETLAEMVHLTKTEGGSYGSKKRKRSGPNGAGSPQLPDDRRKRSRSQTTFNASSRGTSGSAEPDGVHFSQDGDALSPRALGARQSLPQAPAVQTQRTSRPSLQTWEKPPLAGLTVIVIHIKDTYKDGPPVSETILAQLQEHEEALKNNGRALGCNFVISKCGESYWF